MSEAPLDKAQVRQLLLEALGLAQLYQQLERDIINDACAQQSGEAVSAALEEAIRCGKAAREKITTAHIALELMKSSESADAGELQALQAIEDQIKQILSSAKAHK